jgi:hypothetical protein
MTESMHRTLAVTKLPRSVPALLTAVRAILAAMEGNPTFPSPSPPLAEVAAALGALEDAETARQSRTRGTRPVRDEAHAKLVVLVEGLRLHVQGIADATPENAAPIIESAGMRVKRPAVPAKPPFAVKPGLVSGSVALAVIAAGDRAAYGWQWSDDGGVTWHDVPVTMQAKTGIAGLTPGGTYRFRVRVWTKDGERDWGEAVAMIVT